MMRVEIMALFELSIFEGCWILLKLISMQRKATKNLQGTAEGKSALEPHSCKIEENNSQMKSEGGLEESQQPHLEEKNDREDGHSKLELKFGQRQEENEENKDLRYYPLPSLYPRPIAPAHYQQAYLANLMMFRAQQMALHFQVLQSGYLAQRAMKNFVVVNKNVLE